MIDPALENRVVVVTGANNPFGVGAAVAKAFAAQGARVFLHYFRGVGQTSSDVTTPGKAFHHAQQAKTPAEVLQAIRDHGGEAHDWETDLSDPAAAAALFDEAERVFRPVEILVNNAAHSEHDTFVPSDENLRNTQTELATGRRPARVTAESFDRHFTVNTRAVALLTAESP